MKIAPKKGAKPIKKIEIIKLQPRQREALICYAAGLTLRESAEQMGTTVNAVSRHKDNISQVLGVKVKRLAAWLMVHDDNFRAKAAALLPELKKRT